MQRALLLWFASIWILSCSGVGFSRKANLVEYENENENEPRASVHVCLEASRTVASSFTASRRAETRYASPPPSIFSRPLVDVRHGTARHGTARHVHTYTSRDPARMALERRLAFARSSSYRAHAPHATAQKTQRGARSQSASSGPAHSRSLQSSPANSHARLRAGTPGDPPTARSRLAARPTLQFNSKTTIALFSLGARA